MKIKIGCCGFPEARPKYFAEFDVVEIQQTFYEPPRLETARKSREEAPEGFEFTLKAWQLITHPATSPTYRRLKTKLSEGDAANCGSFKPSDICFMAWERTREIAEALRATVIVFQCPASFRPTAENKRNMRSFFKQIDRGSFVFAWEPRGEWQGKDIKELCKSLDLIHCVDPFKDSPVYGKLRYFRLHGIGGYRYEYTSDDLVKLRGMCESATYCMFNNAHMLDDARAFKGDMRTR